MNYIEVKLSAIMNGNWGNAGLLIMVLIKGIFPAFTYIQKSCQVEDL